MAKEYQDETKDKQALCDRVRELIASGAYSECERVLIAAMGTYPHAPEPHNLLGILLEKQGHHVLAMKHFRAAWALDPTYRPVRQNLDQYASFTEHGAAAFDESDCREAPSSVHMEIVYDPSGIGHVMPMR